MIMRLDLLPHVEILVLDHGRGGSLPVLQVDEIAALLDPSLFLLEQTPFVVPDDVGDGGLLD